MHVIRTVRVCFNQHGLITALNFRDEKGFDVFESKGGQASDDIQKWEEQTIPEKKEIIGFYASSQTSEQSSIPAFGLILRSSPI